MKEGEEEGSAGREVRRDDMEKDRNELDGRFLLFGSIYSFTRQRCGVGSGDTWEDLVG